MYKICPKKGGGRQPLRPPPPTYAPDKNIFMENDNHAEGWRLLVTLTTNFRDFQSSSLVKFDVSESRNV